ncbi:MAG: ABC transporter substrate-binding protein [Caldilineaceae bacterium]
MFKQNWRWVIGALLAFTLAACGGGNTGSAGAPAATTSKPAAPAGPVVLHVGWAGSPDTLNPGTAQLVEAGTIDALVYNSLFALQFDGTYKPDLAESYKVADDGKTWTFKIHQGVKFHDGQPLTAKDVAFSFNLYKAHDDFPYLNFYTTDFDKIEAPDDTTVVLTLKDAIPNLESQLLSLYVLPEHIWTKVKDGKAAAEFQNLEMIGSGPFKLKEYKQKEFVHLVANKAYFQTPPKIDEIIFQTFGSEDTLVQALKTGQVDMITKLPNTAVATLKRAENVKLVSGAPLSPYVRDIYFNQVSKENCPKDKGKCTGHPALKDHNVRLALAYATDKQNIIDVAMLGLAKPGLTLVASGQAYWFDNSIKDYPFDIAKANQILDDAGYKDKNGDGVREMPDGTHPLIFRLQFPNNYPELPRVAELLGQTWAKIGVKTEPQTVDPDALTAACCPTFDYDVILWNWSWGPDPNDPLGVMRTDQIASGNNETGYSNPAYDKLYDQQAVELDKAKRKQLVWQMQEMVHKDVVYVIPYYPDTVEAYRADRFQGWITDKPTLELENPQNLVTIEPVK